METTEALAGHLAAAHKKIAELAHAKNEAESALLQKKEEVERLSAQLEKLKGDHRSLDLEHFTLRKNYDEAVDANIRLGKYLRKVCSVLKGVTQHNL